MSGPKPRGPHGRHPNLSPGQRLLELGRLNRDARAGDRRALKAIQELHGDPCEGTGCECGDAFAHVHGARSLGREGDVERWTATYQYGPKTDDVRIVEFLVNGDEWRKAS